SLWIGVRKLGVARIRRGQTTFYSRESGLPEPVTVSGLPQPFSVCGFVVTRAFGAPTLVAGMSGRLMRFDGTRWSFLDIGVDVPAPCVRDVGEPVGAGGAGAFWVATQNGLFRYERGRWSPIYMRQGLPNMNVWCLHATTTPAGTTALWAGTAGGGLARLLLGR